MTTSIILNDITLKLLSSSDCRPPDDLQLVARVISNNGIIESKPAMMSTRNSWTLVVKSDLPADCASLDIEISGTSDSQQKGFRLQSVHLNTSDIVAKADDKQRFSLHLDVKSVDGISSFHFRADFSIGTIQMGKNELGENALWNPNAYPSFSDFLFDDWTIAFTLQVLSHTADREIDSNAINNVYRSIQSLPNEHPMRSLFLAGVGDIYLIQFHQYQCQDALNKAVNVFQEAMLNAPWNDTRVYAYMRKYGTVLLHRFEKKGAVDDLNKSLSVFEDAVRLTLDDHPDKPLLLNNLGRLLSHRFELLGDLSDMDKSVSVLEEAIRLSPDGHPHKPWRLDNLGNSLLRRFERLGDLSDMNKSVSVLEEAEQLTPDGHPHKPWRLDNLGNSLSRRFERLGDLSDMNKSVSLFEDAVRLTPSGHPGKPSFLNNLGNSLSRRFERLGDLSDMNKSVSVLEEAIRLSPEGHPDWPSWLNNLGNSLSRRFERIGDLSDMNKSVSVLEEAIRLTPDGHPDEPSWLNNLGISLSRRFERLGDLSDMNKSVSLFEDAVRQTPNDHPDKPSFLSNLGKSLSRRFERLGDLSDMNKSVSVLKDANPLTPDGHPSSWRLDNLRNSLSHRFQLLGDLSDINKSVSVLEEAIRLTPDGHSDKPWRLNNLGNSLSRRFERIGDLSDMNKSVSLFEDAVRLIPGDHPDKPSFLSNLSNSLSRRFERLGHLSDMNKAFSVKEEAVRLFAENRATFYKAGNEARSFEKDESNYGNAVKVEEFLELECDEAQMPKLDTLRDYAQLSKSPAGGNGGRVHPQNPSRRDMNPLPRRPRRPPPAFFSEFSQENLAAIESDSDGDSSYGSHSTGSIKNIDSRSVNGKILSEGLNREGGLEYELTEALFVICWPNGQCKPRAVDDFLDQTWNGGCIISVWDSDLADAWVDENYDHATLVHMRKRKIGGPIPSMLSADSAALAIFGEMSVSLIRIAEELANLSGFPTIVRPLEEDPSFFRNHGSGFAGHAVNNSLNQGGGSATPADSKQVTGSSSGQDRTPNRADGPDKRQEGEGDSDDDEGESRAPPPPPPPPPSPPPAVTSKEIVHKTDVSLKLSNNAKDKGHFLRLITKVKLYPPNVKGETDHHATKIVYDPSIEGHVDLETRSGDSIKIDNALGSIGFLAHCTDYLQTEHLIPLGYGAPQQKLKQTMGEQRSTSFGGTFGMTGGKPTALVNSTAGKLTSSMTEVADDEITKQWIVTLQRMDCYWRSEASTYRGLNTMIQRYREFPTSTPTHDVQVKYGIAVEVANPVNEVSPKVSFLYRHQIHCWVAVKSKSRVRGLIVLAAHFIPDIRTNEPLWIEGRPTLDLLNMDIRNSSEDNEASSKQGTTVQTDETGTSQGSTDDHFVFAGATLPNTPKRRWTERFFNATSRRQDVTLPISTLVARGWNRTPLGWDHTNMKWYYPVWPELDGNLGCLLDESSVRLMLDWGDGDSEASDSKTQDQPKSVIQQA